MHMSTQTNDQSYQNKEEVLWDIYQLLTKYICFFYEQTRLCLLLNNVKNKSR